MPTKQEAERRSYNQYCSIARSLDVIGERWTLLLIRDLLIGPQRYKDLLESLTGIGTNLLADRLHQLEAAGLINRRSLPPPAGSVVYELTEDGRALEPVVAAIALWGIRRMGQPRGPERHPVGSYFMAMRGTFRAELAQGLSESFEIRVDRRVFWVEVRDGICFTGQGALAHPGSVLTLDVDSFNALLFERITPRKALASGRVSLEGNPKLLELFVRLFSFGHVESLSRSRPAGSRSQAPAAR